MSYLLFAGSEHYPRGGWKDFRSRHGSLVLALESAANAECDWWHIIDLDTGEIVKEGKR